LIVFAATGCAAPRFAQPDPAFQRRAALCDDEESCRATWEEAVQREKACRESGGDATECATPAQDREILASKVNAHLHTRVARERAEADARVSREEAEEAREENARNERELERLRELEKDQAAAREEAADWAKVDVGSCVYAPSLGNCDALLTYVTKYEARGALHLDEAKRTVAQVRAPLIAALDRQMWETARPGDCAGAATYDGCDGVVAYLKLFPAGEHAAEADKALRKTTTRLLAPHRRRSPMPEGAVAGSPRQNATITGPPAVLWAGGTEPTGGAGGSVVHVRAFTKRDGTRVEAHTRAAPRR
jgi:hypothetical protein